MAMPVPPEKDAENHAHVVQVAVGQQHALLLTDEGIVYSWGGSNSFGQLGRTAPSADKEQEPSPITEVLRHEIIVQIACGANHCLALSQAGRLFSWGYNKAGQLGLEGFNPNANAQALVQKIPALVAPFDGTTECVVRSCSCGPESSACVTTRGEVFVWGAISYYLFCTGKNGATGDYVALNNSKYMRGENCVTPVRVRGIPKELKARDFSAEQVTVHRHKFACTLSRTNATDELTNLMDSLKKRSGVFSAMARSRKQDAKDHPAGGDDDDLEQEELRKLDEEFKSDQHECEQRLQKIDDELGTCHSELQRIGRDLTICDQQDTALTESASALEARRSEGTNMSTQDDARKKALETQLSDIKYFRKSNKRTRMQLLDQRDKYEQQLLHLTQDRIAYTQRKQEAEGRAKLIRTLKDGSLAKDPRSNVDDGIDIAMSKRDELQATEPQTLSGVGNFTGFREVMAVSDRALQDVSSALKEVSGAVKSVDGASIVEALEANLKLRKEYKTHIQERLLRAERGRPSSSPLGECPGMVQFFREAHEPAKSRNGYVPDMHMLTPS